VGSDSGKEKRDTTPYTLLIAILAVLLTFFIVMPIMGALYVDLDALRTSLQVEIKRAEKLRKQLQQEIQQQRSE
jgi:flagellar biosynthesis protein FliP